MTQKDVSTFAYQLLADIAASRNALMAPNIYGDERSIYREGERAKALRALARATLATVQFGRLLP